MDAGKQLKFLTLSGFNFGKIDEWQSFEINFTLQNDANIVEFRGIYVRETAPISLLSVELYQNTGLLQQPMSKTYYSKDLAIDNAIAAKNGTFWHGPYTSLPKGRLHSKILAQTQTSHTTAHY